MDPVSTCASAIAIIGFAAQVADGIKKLYDFTNKIEHAPANIRRLKKELSVLRSIISSLSTYGDQFAEAPKDTWENVHVILEGIHQQINSILTILPEEKSSRRENLWSNIKLVLKDKLVKELLEDINRAQTSLNLAINLLQM